MHKMKLLIGLTMVASMANAQGAKKKANLVAQNTVAQADLGVSSAPAMTASPATQTSVADATASKPVVAKKFGVTMAYETSANVGGLKETGSRTLVDAVGAVGLSYKATDKIKTELRHNFAAPIIGDRSQIADSAAKGESSPYKSMDPTIHANFTTALSVLGSKPLTIGNRYYIPVSKDSVDAGSNGILRTQTSLDWDLNPKISLSAAAQARLMMYKGIQDTDATKALGADSKLRLIPQLSATYNFSDAVNAYYSPYMDLVMTGHQRGNFAKADGRNHLWQEVGMNITVASVTINPAWGTKGDAANSERYEGIGSDANSEYYLNLYANF